MIVLYTTIHILSNHCLYHVTLQSFLYKVEEDLGLAFDEGEDFDYEEGDYLEDLEDGEDEEDYGFFDLENLEEASQLSDGAPPPPPSPDQEDNYDLNEYEDLMLSEY